MLDHILEQTSINTPFKLGWATSQSLVLIKFNQGLDINIDIFTYSNIFQYLYYETLNNYCDKYIGVWSQWRMSCSLNTLHFIYTYL